MSAERIQSILNRFAEKTIVVFGDFFLDKYLEIDPKLNEISIETGLTAYQVTGKRLQPGAAGTVCNNLSSLQAGRLVAVGVAGDDGEGFDLKKALQARRVETGHLITSPERFTPTYTKPMLQHDGSEEEIERQDIKNRHHLSAELEDRLMDELRAAAKDADAVIVSDQVQERNCGCVTDRMRGCLKELALECPETLFFCDSRLYIGEFENVTVKPNRFESVRAVKRVEMDDIPTELALECAETLRQRTGRTVFQTLDKEGICPVTGGENVIVPCPPVTGPIDIVGAGDSVTAGIVLSLASGATPLEAAVIGNLVASITIRQIGTTGTATPQQVMEAWQKNEKIYAALV